MSAPFHRVFDAVEPPEDTICLADFVEVPEDDDAVPEAPQWVWCLLSVSGGHQVWAHSQVERHPDGLLYRAAGPLRPNDAGVRIYSGGTEIRLKKAGLVSSQALVLGAAPSCTPMQEQLAESQSRYKRRAHVDSNTLDPSIPISDDTLVDQRCPRFPRDIFVRMARSGAFPAAKIGKRWVAKYGDVKRAFEATGSSAPTRYSTRNSTRTPSPLTPDGLDNLRQLLGFVRKDK